MVFLVRFSIAVAGVNLLPELFFHSSGNECQRLGGGVRPGVFVNRLAKASSLAFNNADYAPEVFCGIHTRLLLGGVFAGAVAALADPRAPADGTGARNEQGAHDARLARQAILRSQTVGTHRFRNFVFFHDFPPIVYERIIILYTKNLRKSIFPLEIEFFGKKRSIHIVCPHSLTDKARPSGG